MLAIPILKSLSCYKHYPAVLIKDYGKWNTIFLQNLNIFFTQVLILPEGS